MKKNEMGGPDDLITVDMGPTNEEWGVLAHGLYIMCWCLPRVIVEPNGLIIVHRVYDEREIEP